MTEHKCQKDKDFKEVHLFIGKVTEAIENIKHDINGLHKKARTNAEILNKIDKTTSNLKLKVAAISSAIGVGGTLAASYLKGIL